MLSAEVLWTGEVAAEGSTSEESDWVEITWSPQGGISNTGSENVH